LGAPLIGRFYAPWKIVEWSLKWAGDFPSAFFLAHLIAAIGCVGACVCLRGHDTRPKPFGLKAWGGYDDAKAAGLFASAGVVLGKLGGEIICYDGPEHHLLVGASRSGKGRGHVVPTLLTWPHSALVLDIKSELAFGDARHGFPGLAGFRAGLGPVLCFAPTRADSHAFNPLFEVRRGANEVRDVQNLVEIMTDPAGDARYADFWDRSAKQVLVGVILHVLYAEPLARKTLAVVRQRLGDLDRTASDMLATLHRVCPVTGMAQCHPEIQHAAQSYLAGEERLRSGVKATAESFFGVFADSIVAENTSSSDFKIGDLVCTDRPVTLFLQPPPSDAARLMPLIRLVLNQAARALMEHQDRDASGREKLHPLLLLLDEFPQLGRMPFFETAMGAMAAYGVKVYLVCQSLNHITRAYGRDSVIIDNCHTLTAFAAADMDTAKRIAEMGGEVWEMRPQRSELRPRSILSPRKGSITYREERRPLLTPGDVRSLPRGDELIFVQGAKPLRAKKMRFDEERLFVSRLRPAPERHRGFAPSHDWIDVRALGRLPDPPVRAKPVSVLSSHNGELFGRLDLPRRTKPKSRGL